jgi:hypothetical protein
VNEEFKETLTKVVNAIGDAVKDAATLTVETWYVTIDGEEGATGAAAKADFESKKRPLARTEIRWDADCVSVIPLRKGAGDQLEVVQDMLDTHNHNVETARKYRSDVMNTFLSLVR